MDHSPLHLNAGCPVGQSQSFYSMLPDGTLELFTLPPGKIFNLTDISVNIASQMPTTPVLITFGLKVTHDTGTAQLWNFVGYISQNVERSFVTPVRFGKNFKVDNGSPVALNVNLFGYLSE